jgi:hypothetical protein
VSIALAAASCAAQHGEGIAGLGKGSDVEAAPREANGGGRDITHERWSEREGDMMSDQFKGAPRRIETLEIRARFNPTCRLQDVLHEYGTLGFLVHPRMAVLRSSACCLPSNGCTLSLSLSLGSLVCVRGTFAPIIERTANPGPDHRFQLAS